MTIFLLFLERELDGEEDEAAPFMFMAQRALLLCIASAGMASAAAFVVPGRHALPSRRMTINADTQAVAARRARFTVLRMADLSLFRCGPLPRPLLDRCRPACL